MMGFTEDLLECVVREISSQWDDKVGNVDYFVNRVLKSGLTTEDLSNYLIERGKVCPVCVTTVFSAVIDKTKGGAL